MTINIKDTLILDDDNEYVVISKIQYENIKYYYLLDKNNIKEKFCYQDKDELVDGEESLVTRLNKRVKQLENQKENSKENELAKTLRWKYFYMDSSAIPTKTSVTKLKEAQNEQIVSIEEIQENQESKFAVARPQFLNEDVQVTGAQKGTLMHMCFQKLDETKDYTKEMLQQLVDDLVYRKIITSLEGKSINMYKLYSYTKSDLFKQIRNAKKVYKEQPFYINLTADEVYANGLNDNILVQGIIDLYFINQAGEVVLVDYKTDYVEKGKELELVEKYKKQLEIYKKALEQALGRNVNKCFIYSVYLEKLLEV